MEQKKLGRPYVQLEPRVLRELRESKGLSQADVGEELRKRGLGSEESSVGTRTNGYQRVEKTGRTSPKTAERLANLFGATVEVLEGKSAPDPADYVAEMATRLREQLEQGSNPALERALNNVSEAKTEEAVRRLAYNICHRIETAQFTRDTSSLNELSTLTGLPVEKLLEPATVEGYWLVTANIDGFVSTTIVRGVADALYQINKIVEDQRDGRGSDNVIRVHRDGKWYRLEIEQPYISSRMRIDFVRCEPKSEGLSWISPSWWDELVLDNDGLLKWAYETANFVIGPDGVQHPSHVSNLRLRVTELQNESSETMISINIPEEVMNNFSREASAHFIVVNWLEGGLRDFLGPRLREYPKRCWTFLEKPNAIEISFWPPPAERDTPHGPSYLIQLVEEVATGQFNNVPWRKKDRGEFKSRIETWLN